MPKRSISISLDPDLVEAIDQAAEKAGEARQVWIGEACEQRLGVRKTPTGVVAVRPMGPKTSAEIKAGIGPIPKMPKRG